MTEPREVVVSHEECMRILDKVFRVYCDDEIEKIKPALAAFLAARVPDAQTVVYAGQYPDTAAQAHNACRDKVLKGV